MRKLNTYLHTSFGEQKLLIKTVFWLQIALLQSVFLRVCVLKNMGALNYFSHVWQISVKCCFVCKMLLQRERNSRRHVIYQKNMLRGVFCCLRLTICNRPMTTFLVCAHHNFFPSCNKLEPIRSNYFQLLEVFCLYCVRSRRPPRPRQLLLQFLFFLLRKALSTCV